MRDSNLCHTRGGKYFDHQVNTWDWCLKLLCQYKHIFFEIKLLGWNISPFAFNVMVKSKNIKKRTWSIGGKTPSKGLRPHE